jgi:hypothetical protein
MKRIPVLTIIVTVIQITQGFVPFNPIINTKPGKEGYVERWKGSTEGIVGWLDVPPDGKQVKAYDRILVLKDNKGALRPIDPENPDRKLPKGLFYWQSNTTILLKFHGNLVGAPDQSLRVSPTALKTFVWKNDEQKYKGFDPSTKKWYDPYDPNQSKLLRTFPDTIQQVIDWDTKRPAGADDRWGFFHRTMGVTEQYFREFLGSDRAGLYSKDRQGVTMPTQEEVTRFFPYDHPDFPDRKRQLPLELFSCEELETEYKKHTPSPNKTGTGSITLIDGYSIYTKAGGDLTDIPLVGGQPDWTGNAYLTRLSCPAAEAARKATDIRAFLQNPLYQDAVIQMASTITTLEGHSGSSKNMLSDILSTPVQGEEVAIATVLGSFQRKYLMNPVNLFDNISLLTQNKNDYKKVKVGWHPNVPVSSGYYKSEIDGRATPENQQRINFLKNNYIVSNNRNPINIFNSVPNGTNQVFNTVNLVLAAAHNMVDETKKKQTDATFAKIVLKADYLATLLVAAINKKEKVILTLMGAGAFAGPFIDEVLQWITDILIEDDIIDIISRNGLQVTIINFLDLRLNRKKNDAAVKQFVADIAVIQQKIIARNSQIKSEKPAVVSDNKDLIQNLKTLETNLIKLKTVL